MPTAGILSLLKGLGKGAKETLTPIARQKTATDEYLNLHRKMPGMEMSQLEKLGVLVEKEADRLTEEIVDLTNKLRVHTSLSKAGGHTAESAAKVTAEVDKAFNKLEAQRETMLKMLNMLHDQSTAIGAKALANKAARMNYDLEKKMSLIKGLIAGTGGAVGGMFLERALNGDEPEDAVEVMEEATQTKSRGTEVGENIANTLMDIISPIPRYK
jgi:hypothetical protein